MIAGCDDSSSTTQKTALGPVIPGPVDADAPEEFTTTESGLKYRIRRKSEGKKPTLFDQVTIHMRGWLDNEEIFQTSYGTGGTPGKFAVKLLPQGVKDGIQHIGEGGMIELEVPPNLA
ncbi:MAG: FKBP-type peptidyl-prolyl cis-trans isomerase, partial [Planctomycetes bacterium]|nr:FKBP-type peptidyl-prolyl cis-trans isomerase [Planctomycetota bacterium]